jgi:C4-dicarboxylate-specific signal transduction histidine kinase
VVLSAKKLSAALTKYRSKPIDLVVINSAAGHGDEEGLLADIPKLWPEALLVIVNSPDLEKEPTPELPIKIHAYIRKPYSAEEIRTTISNALAYKRLMHAHKKSEIALLESKGRLANLVVNALVGIAIIQNNTIVYQNPAQQEIFEGLAEPVALNDMKCVHADDQKKVKAVYQSITAGKTRRAELDFRFSVPERRTSRPVTKTVQCRASVYRHQNEDAILLSMMDMTHARELENLMMIKGKMASLGRVATGIAHEIRNPLTGINSYLFTLEDLASRDGSAKLSRRAEAKSSPLPKRKVLPEFPQLRGH